MSMPQHFSSYLFTVIPLVAIAYVIHIFMSELRALLFNGQTDLQGVLEGSLRQMVKKQRAQEVKTSKNELALLAAADIKLKGKRASAGGRLTVEKKLRYARWRLSPVEFHALQIIVTLTVFLLSQRHVGIFVQMMAATITPILIMRVLDAAVERRFAAFDRDYPVMLMQLVSTIKTGMAIVPALQVVCDALNKGSLVKAELTVLLERLRLGLSEEQAINAFGEDIPHPELELFVESLLLHMRVGGAISSTLERLAKQVRRRQQFRRKAVAAVSLERNSIYAIAFVLTGLLCFLLYKSPELVLPAFDNALTAKVFEGSAALIVLGFYWSTTITRIRI